MKTRIFSKLLKDNDPVVLLNEYMTGKHGTLTDKQLQKIIDEKNKGEFNGRGAVAWRYKKR